MDEQAAMQAVDQAGAAAESATAAMLAGLPREPVSSVTYTVLLDAMRELAVAFGQPPDVFDLTPPEGDVVEQVTPGAGQAAVAFSQFFDQAPAGKKYAFKVKDALANEDGMLALADKLQRAAKDAGLVAAANGIPSADAAPAAKPPPAAKAPAGVKPPKQKANAEDLMK